MEEPKSLRAFVARNRHRLESSRRSNGVDRHGDFEGEERASTIHSPAAKGPKVNELGVTHTRETETAPNAPVVPVDVRGDVQGDAGFARPVFHTELHTVKFAAGRTQKILTTKFDVAMSVANSTSKNADVIALRFLIRDAPVQSRRVLADHVRAMNNINQARKGVQVEHDLILEYRRLYKDKLNQPGARVSSLLSIFSGPSDSTQYQHWEDQRKANSGIQSTIEDASKSFSKSIEYWKAVDQGVQKVEAELEALKAIEEGRLSAEEIMAVLGRIQSRMGRAARGK
ncbi:uncharacterized protein KY384_008013 [Bacidia gigantensis]|uniref:uncharacterized protein n=1 Tax=Bacidia gigantensis TaxID=2732470 RepID=UPI001D0456C2|nr:uncharacterized protein KY384_008013 [Bacidia gigantensis]KAG8527269.1 hypothetical protein KY384_008013 [Bacidia gigantensis]